MRSQTRLFVVGVFVLGLVSALGLLFSLARPIKAEPPAGPVLRLVRATFDPLVDTPDLPAALARKAAPTGEAALYLVQFQGPIQQEWKAALRRQGAWVFDYVPDYAFLVWMDRDTATRVAAEPSVRWVGFYQPAYRFSPRLDRASGHKTVTVVTLPTVDVAAFQGQLEALDASVQDVAHNAFAAYFRVAADAAQLPALASLPPVVWVEPYVTPRLFNDVARGTGLMGATRIWQELGLYGAGQIVAVGDTGLDGGVNDSTLHDDFEGRVLALHDLTGMGAEDICSGHGTHVAGSVLGDGQMSGSDPANHDYTGSYAGIAPEAQLVFQAVEWPLLPPDFCLLFGIPQDLNDLFQQAYDDGARIHTNSWGGDVNGEYTAQSQQTDQFAWTHRDMTILFAAGNSGTDTVADGIVDVDSMAAPGTAKNCITVGATENDRPTPDPNPSSIAYGALWPDDFYTSPISEDLMADDPTGMAAFSSRGPCDDGRIKPDVVAPGTWVLSTYSQANHPEEGGGQYDGWGDPPNRWYKYMGGTSMATPLTAGAAALVREYYNDVAGLATPSSALIKATLINGAYDLTPGQYGTGVYQEILGRPDSVQGWGRVDLPQALIPDAPRGWWYDDHTMGLTTGETVTYTSHLTSPLMVMDGDEPLRVSLVWVDYPGTLAAMGGLVNDLDLTVIGPGGTRYYGNGVAGDRVNNVEGVDILTPTLGVYTITVRAHNVPTATQSYALVASGALGDPNCKTLTGVALQVPDQGSVGIAVPLTATVTPVTATPPVHYLWNFDDGLTARTAVSVTSHVYQAPGTFAPVVTATNCVGGSLVTDTRQLQVVCDALTGVELLTDSPAQQGQPVILTATVAPPDASQPIEYVWDFGDGEGAQGTAATISHLYPRPGLYTATVTATNCGGSAVLTDTARVEVICVTVSGVSAAADDPVLLGDAMHFQASVVPMDVTPPVTYTWDFGAAGTGIGLSGPAPVFTYTEVGTHTVAVGATNCNGSGPVVNTLDVVVQEACQLLDGVTVSADDPVKLGQPVHFQSVTTPQDATRPLVYAWDLGGPGTGSGLDGPSPIFTYTAIGRYTVRLTVTNCAGAGVVTDTLSVGVQDPCEPLTDVLAQSDSPVLLGQPMHFQAGVVPTDASLPISYAWNFGAAGSGVEEQGPTPVFTYTEAGTHTVAVAAINCEGKGTAVDTFPVVVQSTCRPLLGMTAGVEGPVPWGEASHFYAVITPTDATPPVDYVWDFGGVGTGTDLDGPDPVYTYTRAGAYTATVTATNCSGTGVGLASAQVSAHVTCELAQEIVMRWRPQPVYVGALTTFTASVGGGRLPLTYTWRFGDDGTPVTGRDGVVSHTFDSSGTVPVTLTVANPCGVAEPVAHLIDVTTPLGESRVFLPLLLKQ